MKEKIENEIKDISLVSRSHKKNLKEEERKNRIKVSDIFLYASIALTFGFLVFTIVDLIRSVSTKEFTIYTPNFLFSFAMIIVATVIYFILLYLEKGKLEYPEWFKCTLIVGVLVFSLVYPLFNLYSIFWTDAIFNIFLGLIFSIIGVSIFYNFLKNNNNIIRANPSMVMLFSLCFSVTMAAFIELVEFVVRLISKTTTALANDPVIDILIVTAASVILSLMFFFSLKGDKKLINKCLIFSGKNK